MKETKIKFDINDERDMFDDYEQLKEFITTIINKKSFTNNADWGSAFVWSLSNNNFLGTFLYLGDDNDLVLLKRTIGKDEVYYDEIIEQITNKKDLAYFCLNIIFSDITNKNQ